MKTASLLAASMLLVCAGCNGSDGHRHRPGREGGVGYPPPGPRTGGRDAYEPDNDDDRPSRIALGETQARSIAPDDDEDWLVCPLPGPGRYRVEFARSALTLDVDVWAGRRGRDRDEDHLDNFEVRGAGSFGVRVRPDMHYIKLRIRAEDSDRRGRYVVAVYRR